MAGSAPEAGATQRESCCSAVRPSVMTASAVDDRAPILARLRSEIFTAVDRHLPTGVRVAFLNFPNHRNAGDAALWLAGQQLVRRNGRRIVYRSAWNSMSSARMDTALGAGGWIVLNAGGNFGDLYPHGQQALRERVLREWRDHPIVQLPQSIHFRETAARDAMGELVAAHGGFTILCRDQASLAIASEWDATAAYCPDLCFLLGPYDRPEPEVEIVWLGRTDPERVHERPAAATDVHQVDWLGDLPSDIAHPGAWRFRAARRVDDRLVGFGPDGTRWNDHRVVSRIAAATFGPVAEGWTERGRAILGRGQVVVTDRLHGHVLAWLSGIPSVVMDNSYGKVSGVVELTTASSSLTHLAANPDEALRIARSLVTGATDA